jgi:hypothetical protein
VPLASIVVIVLAGVLLAVLLALGVALFLPVVLLIDSENRQLRVRWLAALEYWRPLPGAQGESGLSIAGRPVGLPAGRRKPAGAPGKPRKHRATAGRFLRRCLGTPSIRRAVAKGLRELWRAILRSASLTRRQISVSLPDPAWNGMLAGWLEAQRSGSQASAMHVNFVGENAVFLEVRVYPYRIAKALFLFLTALPYRALLREWRASSAIASG